MGRSHVTLGICAVTFATGAHWLPWQRPAEAVLVSGLVLAGSVLPDIDSPVSHVTRSFGPVTHVLSDIVRFACRRIYRWTRLPQDPASRDPHRTFTHTFPGAVTIGGVLVLAVLAGQIPAAIAAGMLFGMAARAWDRGLQTLATVAGGLLMWDIQPQIGDSIWAIWAALSAGCLLHVYSDCVTTAGAPMSFPLVTTKRETVTLDDESTTRVVQRRRWHMTGPPHWIRFYTGSAVESWTVRGSVVLSLVATYWVATG